MSFIPSAFPRTVRALRPVAQVGQYRCLYAAPSVSTRWPTAQETAQKKDGSQFSQQRRKLHPSPTFQASVKNPYTVLGVDKSASSSEIKKAYYSAAKKYHPDSSKEPNAREKFQDVQSAYEILSDQEKKQQFDQFGQAGFDPTGGAGGFHSGGAGGPFAGFGGGAGGFSGFGGGPFGAEFSFEDLFSAASGRGGARSGNPFAAEVLEGEDINVQVTISFMDAAKGTHKDIKIEQLVSCKTCTGTGMKTGTKKKECGRCGGTGTRVHFMRGGFQMSAVCESCSGNGLITPPGSECRSCHGIGAVMEVNTIGIDIPVGIDNGMRIRVSGEGNVPPTGTASLDSSHPPKSKRGDLWVHISVEAHPKFRRKDSDIIYTSTIPLTTALLGGITKIPTLDGEVDLRVPAGTNSGEKVVIPGMGMKKFGSSRRSAAGDLQVEFKINMPKSLTPSQRTILELLADEFNDKTAKRIMNVSQYADEAAEQARHSNYAQQKSSQQHDESHQGLLKRIWEKLTHHEQHGSGEGKK